MDSGHRACNHYPTPRPLEKQGRKDLTGHEHAIQVGLQHLPQRFVRQLQRLHARVHPRVGDQDVELGQSLPDGFQSAALAHICELGGGEGIIHELSSERSDLLCGLAYGDHPGAPAAQRPDDGKADATRATGDQRRAAFEAQGIALASTRANGSRMCLAKSSS